MRGVTSSWMAAYWRDKSSIGTPRDAGSTVVAVPDWGRESMRDKGDSSTGPGGHPLVVRHLKPRLSPYDFLYGGSGCSYSVTKISEHLFGKWLSSSSLANPKFGRIGALVLAPFLSGI